MAAFLIYIDMKDFEKLYEIYRKSNTVTTDSRKITKDCIFVALKGEHFDGNDFALSVADEGIAGCVIADSKKLPEHERIFHTEDSLKTLQQLAEHHRKVLGTKVLSITGTNGKTTTKELITAVLSMKYKVTSTQGNFNNHLGVPLTLLNIRPYTEIAVVEMGANHPLEIERLCEIAHPDYGIITNIGKAHLEGFGSFQGVINTKNELYRYLRDNKGFVFLNKDNDILVDLAQGISQITYGSDDKADIHAKISTASPCLSINWNNHSIQTNLVGEYNFENVMAAVATGKYFNVEENDIIHAIESYIPTNNRSQIIKTEHNNIIMDAYNANPSSMEKSIRNFRNICGENNCLILGDMLELGKETDNEHNKIIFLTEELHFKRVIFVGNTFKRTASAKYETFANVEDLCHYLENNKIKDFDILIKGSRGIQLEKVLNQL